MKKIDLVKALKELACSKDWRTARAEARGEDNTVEYNKGIAEGIRQAINFIKDSDAVTMALKKLERLETMRALTKSFRGGTFDIGYNAEKFPSGYQVALFGIVGDSVDIITMENLDNLRMLYTGDLLPHFGTWIDEDGKVYLDISIHVKDYQDALKIARDNNQKSIYRWDNGECINC